MRSSANQWPNRFRAPESQVLGCLATSEERSGSLAGTCARWAQPWASLPSLPTGTALLVKIVPLVPDPISHPTHEWGHCAPADTALRLALAPTVPSLAVGEGEAELGHPAV